MKLFVFGLGYSGRYIAERHMANGHSAIGTVRSRDKAEALSSSGLTTRVFSPDESDSEIESDLETTEALLISAPPSADGDPVLTAFAQHIAAAPNLRWIGYLSTVGVYGNRDGDWVDEETPRQSRQCALAASRKRRAGVALHSARRTTSRSTFSASPAFTAPARISLCNWRRGRHAV